MTWEAWVLIIAVATSTIASVTTIGKPRPTITPEMGAVIILINFGLVWLLLRLEGVL